MKKCYAKFLKHYIYLGLGRPSRGLKYCLIDIAETLADSFLALDRSKLLACKIE